MLNRDYYIARMAPQLDSVYLKLLVGMRGTGKSTMFSQIITKLKEEKISDDNHIIHINLEFLENEKFRNKESLINYINKKVVDNTQYFVFLDEIHYLPQFESILTALVNKKANISFWLSCSNSRLLPEDLSSSIYGKYKSYYLLPFSYSETCKFLNTDPKNKNMLLNYLKYGGMPGRFQFKKSSEVKRYLYSLQDSIFLRDIVMRMGINEIEDLNHVMKVVIKNLGKSLSVTNIQDVLIENNVEIPEYRLCNAIDCLCRSLIIRPCNGYNVRTNQKLQGNITRYYLNDLGFTFIYGFDIQNNMETILKNLIWIELKKRGYDLYTGINEDKNIDFVAIRGSKIMYLQIKYQLEDGNTINNEIANLQGFDSLHQRYLLSLDRENFTRKGVIHKNIIDFLLEDIHDTENDDEYPSWVAVE